MRLVCRNLRIISSFWGGRKENLRPVPGCFKMHWIARIWSLMTTKTLTVRAMLVPSMTL